MHANTLHRLFPSAKFDEPLKRYTAWKIGGPADALLEPGSVDELIEATEKAAEHDVPVTILGGGTNVLVRDGGIRGLTIRLAKSLTSVEIEGTHVTADAGVLYPVLANTTAGPRPRRPGVRNRHPRHSRRRSLHERRRLRLRDNRGPRLGRRVHGPQSSQDGEHRISSLSYRHSALHENPGWIVLRAGYTLAQATR